MKTWFDEEKWAGFGPALSFKHAVCNNQLVAEFQDINGFFKLMKETTLGFKYWVVEFQAHTRYLFSLSFWPKIVSKRVSVGKKMLSLTHISFMVSRQKSD